MSGVRVFDRPADVLAAVGEEVGPGEWVELTQDRVDTFADATGDHQWIHVDAERAAAGPFGGTIAHGYLTLALVPVLGAGVVAWEGCSAKINYGTDKVRFPQPLRVGARMRVRGRRQRRARDLSGGARGDALDGRDRGPVRPLRCRRQARLRRRHPHPPRPRLTLPPSHPRAPPSPPAPLPPARPPPAHPSLMRSFRGSIRALCAAAACG